LRKIKTFLNLFSPVFPFFPSHIFTLLETHILKTPKKLSYSIPDYYNPILVREMACKGKVEKQVDG
jgi:hypothetical protein